MAYLGWNIGGPVWLHLCDPVKVSGYYESDKFMELIILSGLHLARYYLFIYDEIVWLA